MAQHSNEHLTIADLSAYLDEEMAPEELALCRTHILSCQPCQAALADLRLTSALLSSMPQVAVPRSFTLPTNIIVLPETPAIEEKTSRFSAARVTSRVWLRSLRVASTLVAVLGVLIFLTGAFSLLPVGGTATSSAGTTSMNAPASSSAPMARTPGRATVSAGTVPQDVSPTVKSTDEATALTTPIPFITPTSSTSIGQPETHQNQPYSLQPGIPPILDLTQPTGRLTIGVALLLLGLLGAIAVRLFNRQSRQ